MAVLSDYLLGEVEVQRFTFRLESVLRFQQQQQQLAETRLRQATAVLQRARESANALGEKLRENARALESALRSGVDQGLWLARQQQSARLGEAVTSAEAEVVLAAHQMEEAVAEYRRMTREVESLALLREQHWQDYQREVERRRQDQLDEICLRRWSAGL